MTTDVASLGIRVESLQVAQADKRLDGLARAGGRADRATSGLAGTFTRLIGPLAATVTAAGTLMKVIGVQRQFDVLNAGLITATGSAEGAAVAFDAIQDFASTTPYDLQQATDSFIKLVNLGLSPSQRALTSYGDTAAAMGKDLNQMIEAVADAATGEFERLKEFGIKASSQGDEVAFTFQGVTTTVKKNSAEIEEYLTRLGENNFAGAMARRMDTLDGALSNLGDEWDKLWLNISEAGVGDAIESSVRAGIGALEEMSATLESGQLQAQVEALSSKFGGLGDDFAESVGVISKMIGTEYRDAMDDLGLTTEDVFSFISDNVDTNLSNIPDNMRAFVKLAAVELFALVDQADAYGNAFTDVFVVKLQELVEKAGIYGKELADKLNPFDGDTFDYEAELARVSTATASSVDAHFAKAEMRADAARQARRDSIVAIMDERNASVKSFEDQMAAARGLREEYDRAAASKEAADLGQFGKGGKGGPTPEEQRAFEKLNEQLMTEEQRIQDSYDRRREIILKNTEGNEEARANLLTKLNDRFGEEAMGEFGEVDTHAEELERLKEQFQARHQLILDNTALTEQERTKLIEELTRERNERINTLEAQQLSMALQNSQALFDGLSGLAKEFAGEQSGIYKAMFAVSKAFAIADSVVKIQAGIADAADQPFPTNLAAMAVVAAETGSILSTIKSTKMNVSGIAHGGLTNVPSESTYLLDKGERVLSPNQNRDLTDFLNGNGGGGGGRTLKLEVINRVDGTPTVATGEVVNNELIRVIIDAAESKFRDDLQEGRGMWNEAQRKFGLKTNGAV